jgi:hypothetical protein
MYEEFVRSNNPIREFVLDFVRPDGTVSSVQTVKDTSIVNAVAYGRSLAAGTTLAVYQHIEPVKKAA